MIVSWFSAGVSSAVATKLRIDQVDKIVYIHIDDHHEDTLRFVDDCQEWFGKPIERLQSRYKSVENACFGAGGRGYVNGPGGAPCTMYLKRRVRKEWEADKGDLTYIWGMDCTERERKRADKLVENMPEYAHKFPLIEGGIDKQKAHQILKASGIKRPAMYNLGYSNNNCIGCVKGGKGYWNHIRLKFPEVFAARAAMERKIGGTCIKGVYLDELDPEAGRHEKPVVEDCGIFCQVMAIK